MPDNTISNTSPAREEREFKVIRLAVEALSNQGISIKSISEWTDISEGAINKFQNSDTNTNFKRNTTASQLKKFLVEQYRFVAEKLNNSNPDLVASIHLLNDDHIRIERTSASKEDIFRHNMLVGRAYDFIYEMLGVNKSVVQGVFPKLIGHFTCYRPGTDDNRLVISTIEFSIQQYSLALEYSHVGRDKLGEIRKADGPVVVMGSYLYLLGDIDGGNGIEYIVIRDPGKLGKKYISGLCVTLNYAGEPIMGPVLLERLENSEKVEPRVIDSESFDKKHLLNELKIRHLDKIKSFGLRDLGEN